MNHYLCIIAGQRTGTTALHSALASTGKFYSFKEIFHTDVAESCGTFLKFSQDRDLRVAEVATEAQAHKVALDYLSFLRDLSQPQVPILDIKLNSWQVLKPFWSYVHEMPFFMKVLLRERALFLFIRRRALVDQIISEQIARSVDKWHNLEDGDLSAPLRVNPAEVAGQARLILQTEAFLLQRLGTSKQLVAIDYEDLFPNGDVNARLLTVLQEKFAISLPAHLTPTIKKNIPDKKRVVANYDEASEAIMTVLKDTPRPPIPQRISD